MRVMGAAARVRAERQFSIDTVMDAYERLYRDAILAMPRRSRP